MSLPAKIDPKIEERLRHLTDRERETYERWLSSGKPPISVSTAAKMFEVFLQGKSTKDIHRLNPSFEWGAIIHARLRDGWDEQQAEFITDMYSTARERVAKAQFDAIEMVSNLLTVTAEENNEKYLKYLQSKNPEDLKGAIKIESLRQFKEAAESLRMLTGQDKKPDSNPAVSQPVTNIANANKVEVYLQKGEQPQQLIPVRRAEVAHSIIEQALKEAEGDS